MSMAAPNGQPSGPDEVIAGGNLTAQLAAAAGRRCLRCRCWPITIRRRRNTLGAGGFALNIYDLEMQHNFQLGSWNNIVWGIGDRIEQYQHHRPHRHRQLADLAARRAHPESGQCLCRGSHPSRRHGGGDDRPQGWKTIPIPAFRRCPAAGSPGRLSTSDLLWAAISRAVRSPTPFDTDVVEKARAPRLPDRQSQFPARAGHRL